MNTQDAEKVARDVLDHPLTRRMCPAREDASGKRVPIVMHDDLRPTLLDLMTRAIEEDRRRWRARCSATEVTRSDESAS